MRVRRPSRTLPRQKEAGKRSPHPLRAIQYLPCIKKRHPGQRTQRDYVNTAPRCPGIPQRRSSCHRYALPYVTKKKSLRMGQPGCSKQELHARARIRSWAATNPVPYDSRWPPGSYADELSSTSAISERVRKCCQIPFRRKPGSSRLRASQNTSPSPGLDPGSTGLATPCEVISLDAAPGATGHGGHIGLSRLSGLFRLFRLSPISEGVGLRGILAPSLCRPQLRFGREGFS